MRTIYADIMERETGEIVGGTYVTVNGAMDETDILIKLTERATSWASRNGYSYDDLDYEISGENPGTPCF